MMLIAAVCHEIEVKPIRGAAPFLLQAMKHIRQKVVLGSVRRALAVTARPEDVDLLRRAIADHDVEIKVAAIVALGRASKDAAPIRPLIDSRNLLVRAAAAHALALQGDRAVLPVLVDLLSVDQARIRSESVRILRALTGERFGYTPYDELKKQQEAARRWRQWVEENGAAAGLTYPFRLETDDFVAFCR